MASVTDIRSHRIPNLLTYPATVLAFLYYGWTNGLGGVLFSAEGWTTGLALLLLPFLIGVMGAGDVKLMAAVGAVLGPKRTVAAFLFVCIAGGIYALVVLLVRRKECAAKMTQYVATAKRFLATGLYLPGDNKNKPKSPKLFYGLAIAIGTLVSVSFELMGWALPL